jgi:amino acid adenylation domain-containing protein
MTFNELLSLLQEKHITLSVRDEKLKVEAPQGVMTQEILGSLKEFKNELLAMFAESDAQAAPGLEAVPADVDVVLSPQQKGLWFIDRLSEAGQAYNMIAGLSLSGVVDVAALQNAFRSIVERHGALRTVIAEKREKVVLEDNPSPFFELRLCDWQGRERQGQDHACLLREHIDQFASVPFDLTRDLMIRAELIRLSELDHALLIGLHHIAVDGWSVSLLIEELSDAYQALSKGEALPAMQQPLAYRDYAAWLNDRLANGYYDGHLRYWTNRLQNLPFCHSLALDFPRPENPSHQAAHFQHALSETLTSQITRYCGGKQITLFMFLQAAFATLLGKMSRSDEVVIGSPVANRNHAQLEDIIGLFANSVVLRTEVDQHASFAQLIDTIRRETLLDLKYSDCPFDLLVETLAPQRAVGVNPLFQIALVLQNNANAEFNMGEVGVNQLAIEARQAKFDLLLSVEEGKSLRFAWSYQSELFSSARIGVMARAFEALIAQVLAAPDTLIAKLDLASGLSAGQRALSRGAAATYDTGHVLKQFAVQCATRHDAIAVVDNVRQLTFEGLNELSDAFAHGLIARGVRAQDCVAVCCAHSSQIVVAMLGIWKIGAIYLPLDAASPLERLAFIARDAQAKLIVSDDSTPSALADIVPFFPVTAVELAATPVPVDAMPQRLAYILYTSGSTGQPKGVRVSHANLAAFTDGFLHQIDELNGSRCASWLWNAAHVFDASFKGISLLVNGTRLIVPNQEQRKNSFALVTLAARHDLPIINCAPGMMQNVLDELERRDIRCHLIVSGDRVNNSLWDRLVRYQARTGYKVFNAYGPTEATVNSCFGPVLPEQYNCIGKPMARQAAKVVDHGGNVLPVGAKGELVIMGDTVALGYLNRPELSQRAFAPTPVDASGATVAAYASGDLVAMRADGTVEFFGRIDQQLKIRGYRIETGEIEACLSKGAHYRNLVLVAKEVTQSELSLVVYFTLKEDGSSEQQAIAEFQAQCMSLPDYMRPQYYVLLQELPLNSSGKLNKSLLPMPSMNGQSDHVEPPEGEHELWLGELFKELLNVPAVSATANFFSLGGHSLLATRVLSRIQHRFNVTVRLFDFMKNPSVRAVAKMISGSAQLQPAKTPTEPLLPASRVATRNPVSAAQRRLWVTEHLNEEPANYNISAILSIDGPLDPLALQGAFRQIVGRHDILRTKYQYEDGELYQIVEQNATFEVSHSDFTRLAAPQITQRLNALTQARFDLASDLPFRVSLARIADDQHVLVVVMHHICSDGWSVGLLIKEFCYFYQAQMQGQAVDLPVLEHQYADYARWQHEVFERGMLKNSEVYWENVLKGAPSVHDLPLLHPRPHQQSFFGGQYKASMPVAVVERLEQFGRRQGTTLYTVMETVFALLLGRWSNSDDVIVGTPVANRQRYEVENLIGFFVNVLPLRTRLEENPTFATLLSANKDTVLSALEHQQVPFERIVGLAGHASNARHAPLVQIMFALQELADRKIQIDGLRIEQMEEEHHSAKFELGLTVLRGEDSIVLDWEFNSQLFDAGFVRRFSESFVVLLEHVMADPERGVHDYAILPPSDAVHLAQWNETETSYDQSATLISEFEKAAAAYPERLALIYRDEQITYAQLERKANQLAHLILSKQAQGPDKTIGLCMHRCNELIVAILAILKTGMAYVPIDPEVPQARLEYILGDSRIDLLVTDDQVVRSFDPLRVECLSLDDRAVQHEISRQPTGVPLRRLSSSDPAYVIYTSGSTGNPKGVQVEHRSAVNLINEIGKRLEWHVPMRFASWTNYIFDFSVCEFFAPLLSGGAVETIPEALRLDFEGFFNHMAQTGATVTSLPPFFINPLTEYLQDNPGRLKLSHVIFGLEPIAEERLQRIIQLSGGAKVINGYGPTETTVACTFYNVPRDKKLGVNTITPVGTAVQNCRLYVLNEARQQTPIGVAGELYVGGEVLAKGYIFKPELTARSFIKIQLQGRLERVYKTGDWVRYLQDGNIEFVGRKDNQVKINGLRIELGEIESKISACSGVSQVAVVARTQLHGHGEKKLLAVIVPDDDAHLSNRAAFIAGIRNHLMQVMPAYMVPSWILLDSSLPMTGTDKVDRAALIGRELELETTHDRTFVVPGNMVESQVKKAWEKILKRGDFGIDENFFDLGGTSLNAVALVKEINAQIAGAGVKAVDVFAHPTVRALAVLVAGDDSREEQTGTHRAPSQSGCRDDVAVIGLSGRFPGAENIETFWKNLSQGRESMHRFSDDELLAAGVSAELIANPKYVKSKAILADSFSFDHHLFGYAAHEANLMDPQLRVLHECVWDAFENAGYDVSRSRGKVGIFGGASNNFHWMRYLMQRGEFDDTLLYNAATLSDREFFMARLANNFNLNGPAVNVQTACSTSLVAVHMAVQSLLTGDSDVAMACGVSIQARKQGYLYEEGMINSPDGHCRAFDADAKGTVGGEGVGAVVLKRRADAERDGDNILALIKGSAINNDGHRKVGFMAPSVVGQQQVILEALHRAGVDAGTIGYVECHGTGTPLGDPIEIEALRKAYAGVAQQSVEIGSLKSNIGHLDAAAGIAGLIKAILCIQHQALPPSLHYRQGNPNIGFETSPFKVNTHFHPWIAEEQTPLRASVSSFGIGGTNAHVVLEQHCEVRHGSESRSWQLLPLSALDGEALERRNTALQGYLGQHADGLADVSYTLQVGRKEMAERQVALVGPDQNPAAALRGEYPGQLLVGKKQGDPSVVFMFPGQGSQYVGMCRVLYQTETVFRQHLDDCLTMLASLSPMNIKALLLSDEPDADAENRLRNTAVAQPAIFAFEYALAKQLLSWGVKPAAMIGHSIGEYVAACLAGVFAPADAIRLVFHRGQLMSQAEPGSMLSVNLSEEELAPWLEGGISIAALNSSELSVLSGASPAMASLAQRLDAGGIKYSQLHTSHAYHSPMMSPVLDKFRKVFKEIRLSPPNQAYLSNVTGDWIRAEEATSVDYWCRHLVGTVDFVGGVDKLLESDASVFIEVGPGNTLSSFVRNHTDRTPLHKAMNTVPHPKERNNGEKFWYQFLANAFVSGVSIDWQAYRADEQRRRLPLPGYAFKKRLFAPGLEAAPFVSAEVRTEVSNISVRERPELSTPFVAPSNEVESRVAEVWKALFKINRVGVHDNFYELGGQSLLATRVLNQLNQEFGIDLGLEAVLTANTVAELAQMIAKRLAHHLVAIEPNVGEENEEVGVL